MSANLEQQLVVVYSLDGELEVFCQRFVVSELFRKFLQGENRCISIDAPMVRCCKVTGNMCIFPLPESFKWNNNKSSDVSRLGGFLHPLVAAFSQRPPPTAWRAYTFSIPLAFGVIFGTMFKNLSLVAKTDTCACVGEWLSICTYVCVLVLRFGRLCVYIMNTATEMFVRFLFTLREWMSWVLSSYSYARIHQPRIFTAEPISKRISLKSMLQYFRQYIHI